MAEVGPECCGHGYPCRALIGTVISRVGTGVVSWQERGHVERVIGVSGCCHETSELLDNQGNVPFINIGCISQSTSSPHLTPKY